MLTKAGKFTFKLVDNSVLLTVNFCPRSKKQTVLDTSTAFFLNLLFNTFIEASQILIAPPK